jgi:hypothetical protein
MQGHTFSTKKHKYKGAAKTKNNIKKVNTKEKKKIDLMRF